MNKIRALRLSKGLTLKELADLVGTTPTQLSRLENGKRKLTQEWIQRIGSALNVSPHRLIEEPTEQEAESEDFVESKIVFEAIENIAGSNTDEEPRVIDRKFYMVCSDTVDSLYTLAADKSLFSPNNCSIMTVILHDTFIDIFKKNSLSAELLSAMRQYLSVVFNAILLHKAGNSEETLDFFGMRKEWKFMVDGFAMMSAFRQKHPNTD